MFKIFPLAISFIIMFSGFNNAYAEEIGYGVIKDGVYSNSYFNMKINLPGKWSVQSKAAQKELMKLGTELISGDDEVRKRVLKATEKQTVNMFSIFKYEQGAPVTFNPSVIALAENVATKPGIKKGADYHFHVKKMLQASKLKYEFPKKIYTNSFSGIPFDIMTAKIKINNVTVYQKYYATRIKDYVLGLVLTYSSAEDEKELDDIIKNLKFYK